MQAVLQMSAAVPYSAPIRTSRARYCLVCMSSVKCLCTQQAFPRSAIFTLSLSAFRGSKGLRTKSEALNPPCPLEQPDCVESADSDVADMTELEKPDRPEAGLEKRAGAWPLHLSSAQEQAEPGLTLLPGAVQHGLPLTTAEE